MGNPVNTIIVRAKRGAVEVRTVHRTDSRWDSEYRFLPEGGTATEWRPAGVPEGFVTEGMALSAAILRGRMSAENETSPDAAAAM